VLDGVGVGVGVGVVVSGHVSAAAARTVQLVYPDGGSDVVAIERERMYVAQVPAAHLAAVHRVGLLVVARDDAGEAVAQAVVPSDAITPPAGAARPHDALEVETVTDHGDMSRILVVRALVAEPAVQVVLRYPDGERVPMERRGKSFAVAVPAARRDDFARAPGMVIGFDASGRQVMARPVIAPSLARSRELAAP
jgi:hypothetical protein